MLTEQECWDRINELLEILDMGRVPSIAEIEKLNNYVNLILMMRRVEALE